MPFDDRSSPGRGVEVDRATFCVAGRPLLLGEAARALCAFLFRIEPFSLNSTDPSSFERLKSRMSFERQLTRFSCGIFYRAHLSQKPSFSKRGIAMSVFFFLLDFCVGTDMRNHLFCLIELK